VDVKPLATLVLAVALVTASANAALAHPDVLGEPDPYWQQLAAASAARASENSANSAADSRAFDALPFAILVCAAGALCALFGASLLRSLWSGRALGSRASEPARGMAVRVSPGDSAAMMAAGPIRTVDVRPPSAFRETRLVLRAAAAIVSRTRSS
jgi:hypothetical protein